MLGSAAWGVASGVLFLPLPWHVVVIAVDALVLLSFSSSLRSMDPAHTHFIMALGSVGRSMRCCGSLFGAVFGVWWGASITGSNGAQNELYSSVWAPQLD